MPNDNPYLPDDIYELDDFELHNLLRQRREMLAALDWRDLPLAKKRRAQLAEAMRAIMYEIGQRKALLPQKAHAGQGEKEKEPDAESELLTEVLIFWAEDERDALRNERVQRRKKHGWEVVQVYQLPGTHLDVLPIRQPESKDKYLVKMEKEA